MLMPFGKYRGVSIEEIDSIYLAWVVRDCDSAAESLREAAGKELCRRREIREKFAAAEEMLSLVSVQRQIRTIHAQMVEEYKKKYRKDSDPVKPDEIAQDVIARVFARLKADFFM